MMNMIVSRQPSHSIEPVEPQSNSEDLGVISVQWVLAFLARRWMLIGATGLLVSVLSFTTFLFQPSKFTATALMMINPGTDRVLTQDQMVNRGVEAAGSNSAPVIESQLEIARSEMLLGRLVDTLNLTQDPEWNASLRRDRGSALAFAGAAAAERGAESAAPTARSVRQAVIQAVGEDIHVRRRSTSFAAEVSATSRSPQRAAEMANGVVNLFIEYQFESNFEATQRANKWLEERLKGLREDLQQKEAAASRFQAENNLPIITDAGDILNSQKAADLQASIAQARAVFAEKQARYRQVQQNIAAGGSAATVVGVLDSELIAQLRAREADIARRQADLESRYGELHPAVVNVRAERQDIQNQINAEVSRITTGLRDEVEIARAGLTTLESEFARMRGQLAGDNDLIARYRELKGEADAARAVHQNFLERFHVISGQAELRPTTVQLVSAASVPMTRSSPNLKLALLISLALGFGLGVAAGFLADALGEGFRSPEEVERGTGMQTLASVPRLRRRDLQTLAPNAQHPAGYLIERQMSEFTESMRVLRTTIQYSTVGQPRAQIVAITSALPDEGKTTVSLCLSRVAALSQQRVLLIDCDLRRRSLKEVLELEPQAGLVEVLAGSVHWRQAVLVDEASGMHLLPLSDSGFTPKDVFGGEDMNSLLEELRGSFDLIVLDCAPVLAVAETRVVVAKADCTVLVARWERTPVRAVRTALRQLTDAGANVRGVTLNHIGQRLGGRVYKMEGYYQT